MENNAQVSNKMEKGLNSVDPDSPQHPPCLPGPSAKSAVIYPSTWLKDHAGQKPSITILENEALPIFHHLQTQLNQNKWDDIVVSSFMVRVIQENKEIFYCTSDSDWTANDRLICRQGEEVCPLNLLDIEEKTGIDIPTPTASTQEERLSMFLALLTIYRKALAKSGSKNSEGSIDKKLTEFYQRYRSTMKKEHIDTLAGFIKERNLTSCYKKLVAALDMFFVKYYTHKHSKMRTATLESRYKGCAALLAFSEIARKVGLEAFELAFFVSTSHVASELKQIYKPKEGLDDAHNYFPYQLDFGLTSKSPYSVSANPNLYLWLHTIGALLMQKHSICAVFPRNACDVTTTIHSALAVELALHRGTCSFFSIQFVEPAFIEEARARAEAVKIDRPTKIKQIVDRVANEGLTQENLYKACRTVERFRDLSYCLPHTIGAELMRVLKPGPYLQRGKGGMHPGQQAVRGAKK